MLQNITMGQQSFTLKADRGLFKGLANQNMLFHQCICELVDNCIASKRLDHAFKVDVIFSKIQDTNNYTIWIVDNGRGMSSETLMKAIQPGDSATTDNRLNEHGFGLKHSLATLTKKTGNWKIWTKDLEKGNISSVSSPFQYSMNIEDDDVFPELPYQINDASTIVKAETTLDYIQSAQGRGNKAEDINKLRQWVVEHLGVAYRGYLTQDPNNDFKVDGVIYVSINQDKYFVPPIEIPMEATKSTPITLELGGTNYQLYYNTGFIDENKRNTFLKGAGLKAYYQQNTSTQGIDIRLGKRVIATKQLTNIFGVKPHNKYNIFCGELVIPEMPRGILKTMNNKTDIDYDDNEWMKIFETLRNEYPIPDDPRFAEEEELKIQWKKKISSVEPRDTVTTEEHVWGSGVRIDVYRKKHDTGEVIIYELKAGKAAPIDLYQLKMYWDGLVNNGNTPSTAILICESFDSKISDMANKINLMKPQDGSKPYKFSIQTIEELELIKQPKKSRNK
jgi:hypothetical protein